MNLDAFTAPPAGTPVRLVPITAQTVRAIVDLQVTAAQAHHVASNATSLAQALFHPEAWYRAVVAGDTPVGFVMVEDQALLPPPARPASPEVGLWRFMIDHRAQRRGFGRAALFALFDDLAARPGLTRLWNSFVPGPHSPQAFYEALGFVATGAMDGDEVVMVFDLAAWRTLRQRPPRATLSPTAQALADRMIRHIDDAPVQREQRAPLYDSWGARLAAGTAAQQLGASIDTVAPGMRSCPYHLHHAQEEMFFVLEGHGSLRVAGELLPIRRGDLVFIPAGPAYPHQIINTSDAPLRYLSISTTQAPEVCEYPDSGKLLAMAGPAGARDLSVVLRQDQALDYWEGEP